MNNGQKPNPLPKVFWALLMERSLPGEAAACMLDVAMVCGANGYERIDLGYMRTDMARNLIVEGFLKATTHPDDTLVMLDADHLHPAHIVPQLARAPHEIGVIGALAYRRGGHCDPCWYVQGDDGQLHAPMTWDEGKVYECAAVGTGAIAIKRWVFEALDAHGYKWPYFRYEYPTAGVVPSEDIVFARACLAAGIKHHCDTGLLTPHLLTDTADGRQWRQFINEHLEKQKELVE